MTLKASSQVSRCHRDKIRNARIHTGHATPLRASEILSLTVGLRAVDARGVDLQQYVHGVPCPVGYLGRRYTSVEPQRHGGVPQVVRATSEAGSTDA